MAFMCKERKEERMPAIKAVLAKYGMKGSVAVRNYSSLVLTLSKGKLDIPAVINERRKKRAELEGEDFYPVEGGHEISFYNIDKSYENAEEVRNFLVEIKAAMEGSDYYDRSDIMTDYFDRSHYIEVKLGRWNKPYEVVAGK